MIAGPQYEPAGVQEPRCTDGYERLRCQAVRPGTGRDRGGIAVLARQGVALWLHSLAELPVSAPVSRPCVTPVAAETEMIDILLAMARQHLRGGQR